MAGPWEKYQQDAPAAGPWQKYAAPKERSFGEKALRAAEVGAQGFMNSLAETAGAIPDASAWLMYKLGLSQTPPGTFTNLIKQGSETAQKAISAPVNAALGRGPTIENAILGKSQYIQPETTAEKFAYGAGHGAADAASMFLPAAAVARAGWAGPVTRGVAETLATQPIMQTVAGAVGGGTGEATDNPLLGLLAALAVPVTAAGIRTLVTPAPSRLTAEQMRLAGVAADEGINLTAGQRTGSKPVQAMESVFEELPFTSGPQAAIRDAQQTAFNRAVLQRAGIDADLATPELLDQAQRQIGQQFENISNQITVGLDDQFLTDLQAAATRYAQKLPTNVQPVFQSYVDDILNQGDQMAGAVYQDTRSTLTRQVKEFSSSNPSLSNALRMVRDALDDAANRSIPENLAEAWRTTRTQYANLKAIMNAMERPSAGAAAGNVSPASLWSAVKQGQSKHQFVRGYGELNDLARVGQTFIKEQIPNSGTPIRTAIRSLLTGGPAGAGATLAAMGHPAAGAAVAGSLALPPLVQAAVNSRAGQAYLTNQLLANPILTAPLLQSLLAAQAKRGLTAP